MVPMEIADVAITHQNLWQLFAAAFTTVIILWWLRNILLKRTLFKLCGVPRSGYRLLGSNLIWPMRRIHLNRNNLVGIPSAVFLKNDGNACYVCQYIPRHFDGRIKVRERYQALLLMGLIQEEYEYEVIQGAILYKSHLEPIKFEPVIYKQLLDLQDEYKQAIHEWVPPNVRPLFNRD
jgi:hypothetical protein